MRSDTEGWSNTSLNNRIEELEGVLEAVKVLCDEMHRAYLNSRTTPQTVLAKYAPKIIELLDGVKYDG